MKKNKYYKIYFDHETCQNDKDILSFEEDEISEKIIIDRLLNMGLFSVVLKEYKEVDYFEFVDHNF